MKEFINKLVNSVVPLGEKINNYLAEYTLNSDIYPLYIALFGVVALIAVFIFAVIYIKYGKLNRFKKDLLATNKYIESIGIIDEDEVPELYNKIEKLPNAIQQGWSKFMDQQVGYPSDYIDDDVVFSDKKVDKIKSSGRHLFTVLGEIVVFITLFAICLSSIFEINDVVNNPALAAVWTKLILNIFIGIAIPNVAFLIFYIILVFMRNHDTVVAAKLFDDFQDNLDRSVTLMRDEIPEYVSENMQEINAYIDEILKNKLDDKEIIELITTPVFDYKDSAQNLDEVEPFEEVESEVAAEDALAVIKEDSTPILAPILEDIIPQEKADTEVAFVEEKIKEDAVSDLPKDFIPTPIAKKEARRRHIEQLKVLVEMAIKDKENTSKQDLEDLAVIIATAKENGYPDVMDQEILDDCLYMLSDLYYA